MKRRPSIPPQKRFIATAVKQPCPATIQANAAKLKTAFALHQQGLLDQAENLYKEILQSEPQHFDGLQLLATIAVQRNNLQAAIDLFDQAIKINPLSASVFNNRGNALLDLKRLEQALDSYDRAIKIQPDYAEALNNRGIVLCELKRFEQALDSYRRAIKIQPSYAKAFNNLGNALLDLERPEQALDSYNRAIAIQPDYADALYNRGNVLSELKRPEQALEDYERALGVQPDYAFLYGTWLHTKMKVCNWIDVDKHITQLAGKIEWNEKVTTPFPVLALLNSPILQRKAAEIYIQAKHPVSHELPKITKRPKHDKIRIGYFSADFRNHPVSTLTVELYEKHDRSKFELTAFSFGSNAKDEMRDRVAAGFDRFIDVRNQSDKEVAVIARDLEIDIAVDLGGHTQNSRTNIFAMRAAPIQVSYLGYLGTMGAEYIDYLIADATILPENDQQYYVEKIAYLPSYQINDTKRLISDKTFTRSEFGLPQMGFVFCCFNNNYKITPNIFETWMRILKRVDGSILWLLEGSEKVVGNLRKKAESSGVNADRLIFTGRIPVPEYLARYRMANLFLDTQPYNAGTTASDALWAGLPVLTCLGETFAGRVAASLLNAIHLPELIAATPEAYETLAVELATNPARLEEIKQKLAGNRLTTPLFDSQLFSQHIEAAYTEMYERYHANLAPEHIYVS